jgi:two-component system cell cycle sensor histidine kinase/response regulator CckA
MASVAQKIREQSLRAGKLTSQLLAFAGGQILQPRKLNLNTLAEEEMGLLARIIGEDIEVRVVASSELPTIFADPTQIEQVLMNLSLNARDAMPDGGQLVIETHNVEVDARFCGEHGFGKPGNYVLLSVSDIGIGMDTKTAERMFEPFFTTKDSVLGNGTTFRVYLPAVDGMPVAGKGTYHDKPLTGTETILLAEDHEGLRDTAQEILQSLGYHVLVACDGKAAIELFKTNVDQIDLIIMDVVMLRLSGPQAYLEMSAMRPGIRVIFTTGYTPKIKSLVSMVEEGASILQKPYSLASLSQRVRAALEHQLRA